MFRKWRRLDRPGLELARIETGADGFTVASALIDGGEAPFALRYRWTLDAAWRTRALRIEHIHAGPSRVIERAGDTRWRVDGRDAPHLDGCAELDLSATPFCNALAIRLLGGAGELTCAYVDAPDLSVQPSRQRYERLEENVWRYIDLGVAEGFTAVLRLDADGLVETYEGLFEALD